MDGEKKKRKRPDVSERCSVHVDPKELSQQIEFSMTLFNLPDIDTNDAEAVKHRLGEYFVLCNQYEMKPSFAGMASALGTDRRRLWEWCNDAISTKPKEVTDTLKKARDMLNQMLENWMQNGQVNPVVGIFLGKNNFNYKDQSEVVVTPRNPLGEIRDREELEEVYKSSIPQLDDRRATLVLPPDSTDADNPELDTVSVEHDADN